MKTQGELTHGRREARNASNAEINTMCNLYSLNKNRESVAKMFNVGHNRSIDIPLLPGIFPNYNAPVVRQALDGERENHQP